MILIRHKGWYIYIILFTILHLNSMLCFETSQSILNFRVLEVGDTRLRLSLLKNRYLSHDFEPFWKLEH